MCTLIQKERKKYYKHRYLPQSPLPLFDLSPPLLTTLCCSMVLIKNSNYCCQKRERTRLGIILRKRETG